jgi:pyruvyltransferase
MTLKKRILILTLILPVTFFGRGLALFYWDEFPQKNFGDQLSKVLVERIVGSPLQCYVKKNKKQKKKLLAIGSILYFANDGDVVWGSGVNGKFLDRSKFDFKYLDVRSVRGPLTRRFLMENFHIYCPEVYGDPALLFPYFFPEFKKSKNPSIEYLVIPHLTDEKYFPKTDYENVLYLSEPWDKVVRKILDAKFVISSSLHGLVIAEAYGIPARALRVAESPHNTRLKYFDYYLGTGRTEFEFASSVEEALRMGGEPPCRCDLQAIYDAFPKEYWPEVHFKQPIFR